MICARSLMRGSALGLLLLCSPLAGNAASKPLHKLLVVSVDGLDWRYLRDRDQLGLKIANIRRLLQNGRYAKGVVGVWPTITWPSHTSLITGVQPGQHGILGNRRSKAEGGEYYWSACRFESAHSLAGSSRAGLDHGIRHLAGYGGRIHYVRFARIFSSPQWRFHGPRGDRFKSHAGTGGRNIACVSVVSSAVGGRSNPDLAVLYLLKERQPDLILLHLVDLDSEEHDQGPFGKNANAVLERTDELLGTLLNALPQDYDFALVSDHGFERVDKTVNPRVLLARHGIRGDVQPSGGIVTTTDGEAGAFLRQAASDLKTVLDGRFRTTNSYATRRNFRALWLHSCQRSM